MARLSPFLAWATPFPKVSSKNSLKVSALSHIYMYVHLGPGDFVEADEIIARIETDKVTVDITSPEAGVIQ